jgi:5-methylcytosine-specific restriction endonuclease McrA
MTLLRVCRCADCQRADSSRRRQKPSGQVYADPRWKKTRKRVLERDDHTCQRCRRS